jgi:hypothetical protein
MNNASACAVSASNFAMPQNVDTRIVVYCDDMVAGCAIEYILVCPCGVFSVLIAVCVLSSIFGRLSDTPRVHVHTSLNHGAWRRMCPRGQQQATCHTCTAL